MVGSFAAHFAGMRTLAGLTVAGQTMMLLVQPLDSSTAIAVEAVNTVLNAETVRSEWSDMFLGITSSLIAEFGLFGGMHGSLVFTEDECPIEYTTGASQTSAHSFCSGSELDWN